MAGIDALIRELVEQGGSDLHLGSGRPPMIRTSGSVMALDAPALSEEEARRLIYEIMPESNRKQFEETSDTDFGYEIADYVRMRVNVYRDRYGIGAVLRAIPCTIIPADRLGLPESVYELCRESKGLVVVTGPTGSGKSTTLAAMVDLINASREEHIITIEDPVEFVHKDKKCRVTQREVHHHTRSFASALRAALRQDPDIVLVGEMRDFETMQIAIETAETGHLVFGTCHTSSAAKTVDRIIDSFPADRQNQVRSMLAGSLKGVVAQTLCKRKAGGRVAALEVLVVNQGVSSLIRDGKTYQIPSAMQVGRSLGMKMLNDSLIALVREDAVDPEEAYLKANDKADLLKKYEKFGIELASEEEEQA